MMTDQAQFEAFEASELYCPTCRRSQPVRRHLLLVLPTGTKYEYRCAACGASLGGKDDNDASEYRSILLGGPGGPVR